MIAIDGGRFIDDDGRTLILRGVNLAGSSKIPLSVNGPTHRREGFFDHRSVSFVGRPFPLADADEHFTRLRAWGFTFLRFLITWEAIEHSGPGIYDTAYLDYLEAIVAKAREYGLSLYIDPHQDVWSRFTGGDGAPGWTLEAVGMDLTNIHESGAAVLHQMLGDPFPRMVWPTNNMKLAAGTMFTLFFGGNAFAPKLQIAGEPAQEYLQRHYCAAIAQVATRLRAHPNVVGYDTLNEPHHGFIGHRDLGQLEGPLNIDAAPTPYQSMLLGAGISQRIPIYELRTTGPKRVGDRLVNPSGVKLWREGAEDVWRSQGVWDVGPDGTPRLMHPDYFAVLDGRSVDFANDYYRPFANRYAEAIRAVHPNALIFLQTEVGAAPPRWGADDAHGVVYEPHWYDVLPLLLKSFSPFVAYDTLRNKLTFGPRAIRRAVAAQFTDFQREAHELFRDAPVLLGETGIPFDLNGGRAYRTGNFRAQVAAANRTMTALEDTLMSCTWWNYSPDNDHAHGDQWNGEDLSIFSRDEQIDSGSVDSGGRALSAIVRPYARAIAGEPRAMHFDHRRGTFAFTFRHDPQVSAPTEIFIPAYHYPYGVDVSISDGTAEFDATQHVLRYRHTTDRAEHTIHISRAHKPKR